MQFDELSLEGSEASIGRGGMDKGTKGNTAALCKKIKKNKNKNSPEMFGAILGDPWVAG